MHAKHMGFHRNLVLCQSRCLAYDLSMHPRQIYTKLETYINQKPQTSCRPYIDYEASHPFCPSTSRTACIADQQLIWSGEENSSKPRRQRPEAVPPSSVLA